MPSYRSQEAEAFLAEARTIIEESRTRFREGVAATIAEGLMLSITFEDAIGEVSAAEMLDAWRREMIKSLQHDLEHSEEED